MRVEWFNEKGSAKIELQWESKDKGIAKAALGGSALQAAKPAGAATTGSYTDGLNLQVYQDGSIATDFKADYTQFAPADLKHDKAIDKVQRWCSRAGAALRTSLARGRHARPPCTGPPTGASRPGATPLPCCSWSATRWPAASAPR